MGKRKKNEGDNCHLTFGLEVRGMEKKGVGGDRRVGGWGVGGWGLTIHIRGVGEKKCFHYNVEKNVVLEGNQRPKKNQNEGVVKQGVVRGSKEAQSSPRNLSRN